MEKNMQDFWVRLQIWEKYPMERVESRRRWVVEVECYNGNMRVKHPLDKSLVRKDYTKCQELYIKWYTELKSKGIKTINA